MHIGYGPIFQNLENRMDDAQLYRQELALALKAEPMGFDSIWQSEHHFTDYEMTPDVLQFLTYMAGRTKTARLGSMVVVLPWHNPLRVAENISLLDHYSGGRYILGLGRGLGRFEMEGWNVDMNQTRTIFDENAEALITALRTGTMSYDGQVLKQPARDIRPYPPHSFEGRSYGAGNSPESIPVMVRLGLGPIVFPFKSWEDVRNMLASYRSQWRDMHRTTPPLPGIVGFLCVDKDPAKAEAMAWEHIGTHYKAVCRIYEFGGKHFQQVKGYEHYAKDSGADGGISDDQIKAFVDLMPWGTPKQVIDKIKAVEEELDLGFLVTHFRFGHMDFGTAEKSMRLFAEEVMPTLKSWNKQPFPPIPAGTLEAAE